MRIGYVLIHDIKTNDGITKKILGQKTEWEKLGHNVEVFTTMKEIGDSILQSKQYVSKSPFKLRFQLQKCMIKNIDEFNPDILYFRYNTWSRTWNLLLEKYKSILELNTYDIGEFLLLMKKEKTIKSIFRFLGYMCLRSLLINKSKGLIGVTKEIVEHKEYAKFNKPSIFIPNGINLNVFNTIKTIKQNNTRIGLFFIGSPGAQWHGIEHIKDMAKNMPEYDFHMVGVDGVNTDNLFWYGYMEKKDYIQILKKCNICIGSLALYKNDMNEASPLKVREYLAYGYPVILGYDDTVFIDRPLPEWVLKINTRVLLDYRSIRNFIENNKNRIVTHDEIQFIDSIGLETKRLDFFTKICKQ